MIVLRRVAVGVGFLFFPLQYSVLPNVPFDPVVFVMVWICIYNEVGRWLLTHVEPDEFAGIANAQIALDCLAIVGLMHFAGGIANPSIAWVTLPFFAAGAVLPISHAFCHVGAATLEVIALAYLESHGMLPHRASAFFTDNAYLRPDFLALTVVNVTILNSLLTYASHYLSRLLTEQEAQARKLAADRGTLLATNEREAERVRTLLTSNERVYGRVRALLDVAQHVSGTHSVDELLYAVCETTVALVRVPRVEIFLWDEQSRVLRLAEARGLTRGGVGEDGKREYPEDFPIVAQLRAGQVVDFGAAPAPSLLSGKLATPFRRGFAAPMVCRGSFEGALFVGYDEENTEELMELVQGIARQAAVALVNVRALQQQQEDAEVSRGLLGISQELSQCLDEEDLWTLLVRGASQTLELPWASASRFEEKSGIFRLAATVGMPEQAVDALRDACFRLEDFPVLQEVLSRRAVVVIDETTRAKMITPIDWMPGSLLIVPLLRSGWVAGFITVGDLNAPRVFNRRQVRLAEGLGHHASIALHNARLVADLEAADQLKTEFVSTMSHELRTPLNVIIGFTEMLREGAVGPVNPQQLDLIQRLDARGRELLELIEATLHVGRLEAGRDTVELAPIELSDLVAALQASTSGLPRPEGVGFEWEVPAALDEPIITDRAKLALVVRNLVSNAFKFTPEGKVLVRMMARGDSLIIEVKDTGIGMSEEHLPIIFEMFRQVDGSMTRRHNGVGLGLYIVKQFTSRLSGTVDVRSKLGEGTTFRVVLPGAVKGGNERERTIARRRLAAA